MKIKISNYLYHATYRPLLPSIQKYGLGGKIPMKNYSDSKNVVCFAINKDIAESYAECSETVPEEWLDDIVILKVNIRDLDVSKLSKDSNVRNESNDTFEYHDIVPYEKLTIV